MIVLDRVQVRERVDLDAARAAVPDAFVAHARGESTPPRGVAPRPGPNRGDLHVKGAWRHGDLTFTIKVATSFPGAAARGLPAGQGLSLVFDARTRAPVALLEDGGWLTDVRTAPAGALAVDALAPTAVARLAVLGTGAQARRQLEGVARVRAPAAVVIWGRRAAAAHDVAAFAREELGLPATAGVTAAAAVRDADVVLTVTAARRPLLPPGLGVQHAAVAALALADYDG